MNSLPTFESLLHHSKLLQFIITLHQEGPRDPGSFNCALGFRRGHYEKHFCKIILTLDQEETLSLKIFIIYNYGSPFVQQSRTVCALCMVEGIKITFL